MEPEQVGVSMLDVVLSNVKASKLLDWFTTNSAPQGWSVSVTDWASNEPECDLYITVSTPMGLHTRWYTVAEQVADAQIGGASA